MQWNRSIVIDWAAVRLTNNESLCYTVRYISNFNTNEWARWGSQVVLLKYLVDGQISFFVSSTLDIPIPATTTHRCFKGVISFKNTLSAYEQLNFSLYDRDKICLHWQIIFQFWLDIGSVNGMDIDYREILSCTTLKPKPLTCYHIKLYVSYKSWYTEGSRKIYVRSLSLP